MKLSTNVMASYDSLTPDQKARVDALVRRHANAMTDMGLRVESYDRLYIESMELVSKNLDRDLDDSNGSSEYPRVKYDVYTSPTGE